MNAYDWEPYPPYDKEQADKLRDKKQIWGCYYCLYVDKNDRPYWPAEFMRFIGHRIACPNHWRQNRVNEELKS